MERIVVDNSSSDIEDYILTLENYFYTDRTDLYFKEVHVIENYIRDGKITFSSVYNLSGIDPLLDYYRTKPIVLQIYDDIALYEKCSILEEFINSNKPDSDYNGIKTWFKREEGIMRK